MPMDFKNFLDIDWVAEQSTLANNLGIPLSNRFVCLLNAPKILTDGAVNTQGAQLSKNGWLEIQVISVDCPDISLESAELELDGKKRFYFKGRSDGDLTIGFLESPDLIVRRFFYTWMQYALDVQDKGKVVRHYMNEFTASDMIVAPLDFNGQAHYGDRFLKVFPVKINSLQYNYSNDNDVIKTEVTFKYVIHRVVSMPGMDDVGHRAYSKDGKLPNLINLTWNK